MKQLLIGVATLLAAGSVYAGDKVVAGTDGTASSWEGKTVLLVESCEKDETGTWDYVTCVRVLRQKTAQMLCDRGVGTYQWSFQVGSEKSKLGQTTTCKIG